MATEGKTKAPAVDGKRLAQLEAGVSALALCITANGIDLKEGQDPIDQAIALVKRWRELTIARAELQLVVAIAVGVEPETIEDPFAAAHGALETMKAHCVELETDVAAASKRVAELELENAELQTDVEDLTNAKNTLANKLADEGKAAHDPAPIVAAEEPAPAPLERPETARDVGPTFGALTLPELQQAVAAGLSFELAFSNGEFELVEFSSPPIVVQAADLQLLDGYRHVVRPAIHIKGGAMPQIIKGAGLLLEGVQVAYHGFTAPLTIHPGAEWKFERQIAF